MKHRIAALLLLSLYSTAAFAASSDLGLFQPPPTDRSVYYLTLIFGTVGTILDGSNVGNPLIGHLFRTFNTSIFVVGVCFISISAITSIIRMGAEGAILGRQVSNLWVPVRSAVGLLILTPTASGYCFLQVLAMWIILNGIGAADAVWNVMLENTFNTVSVSAIESADGPLTKHLFKMAVCQEFFNTEKAALDFDSEMPDYLGRNSVFYHTLTDDSDTMVNYTAVMGPVDQDHENVFLCGGLLMPPYDRPPLSENVTARELALDTHLRTYHQAIRDMYPAAYEVVHTGQGDWIGFSSLHNARLLMRTALANGLTREALGLPDTTSNNAIQERASADGWIHAGSMYFTLMTATQQETAALFLTPDPVEISFRDIKIAIGKNPGAEFYDHMNNIVDQYWNRYQEYKSGLSAGANRASGKLKLKGSNSNNAMGIQIIPDVTPLTMRLINAISHNEADPIYALSKVGIWIIQIIEMMWFITILTSITVAIVAGVMNSTVGGGDAIMVIVEILAMIMNLVMVLFWAGAVLIGIYLPMIPYLVYLVASIGWFTLVIEAMTAAPLVALGFLAPNQEEFGKAGHGMMLITNVFLRPMLMVVGFAAATELVRIMARILHYGFQSTLSSQVGATGIFAAIAIMGLYIGIILSIVNECFSLIYVLPDRVMRWIGLAPEQSSAERALKQMKQKSDEAGKTSQEMGQGAAQFLTEKAKGAAGSDKKESSGGEGGSGGGGGGSSGGGGGGG